RDTRGGNHAGAACFHPHRRKPLQKSVGNPSAGDARVLPNHHPRPGIHAHQIVPQRPPNPINTVARQREFSRDPTNPVRTEELSGLRHGYSVAAGRQSLVVWWRGFAPPERGGAPSPHELRPPIALLFFVSRTFHDNRHANWGRVHNLDQRIRDVGLRHKRSPRHGSSNIHRIRGGVLHRLDAVARSGDRDARRISDQFFHSHAARKISGHTRSHLDYASRPIIEGELKLTGNDLHDFHILWHMHLPP